MINRLVKNNANNAENSIEVLTSGAILKIMGLSFLTATFVYFVIRGIDLLL